MKAGSAYIPAKVCKVSKLYTRGSLYAVFMHFL